MVDDSVARIRTIKPEMPSDVKLASVSRDARLTFVYAMTQADDLGLLPGNHRQLLGILFPLDDDVDAKVLLAWIEELVTTGLLRWRSTRDGVPVLELVNWSKHQRIDNAGRSQLAALLVESPEDLDRFAATRGDPLRDAEVRGLDHRPSTEDRGPSKVSLVAIALSVRANQGLAEHKAQPQPMPGIMPTSARTLEATEAIIRAGIDIDWAEREVYELARKHNADGPVKSLKYFVPALKRGWDAAQAEQASGNVTPLRPRPDKNDPFTALDQWAKDKADKERAANG